MSADASLGCRSVAGLALISIATVGALLFSLEWIGRAYIDPPRVESARRCFIFDDAVSGAHGIPNTQCWLKASDGDFTEYRLNSSGDRAAMEREPKDPKHFRIVLVGSSMTEGASVAWPQTFAARLPVALTERLGKPVEVYDEGLAGRTNRAMDLHFPEVVAAHPDLILYVVTEYDVRNARGMVTVEEQHGARPRAAVAAPRPSLEARVKEDIYRAKVWVRSAPEQAQSRIPPLLTHFLYKSPSIFVKQSLAVGLNADFLRVHPSAEWQDDMRWFEHYMAAFLDKAEAAGIPVVVVVFPTRLQAELISLGESPAGFDPFLLGTEVDAIARRHGAKYVDILKDYRSVPDAAQYYYPIDLHMKSGGHAILTSILARELTSGSVPQLAPAAQTEAALVACGCPDPVHPHEGECIPEVLEEAQCYE